MKNNYICHAPYLRNSITYYHDFWYTVVKGWYLQTFIYLFLILIFQVVREVKGQNCSSSGSHCLVKNAPANFWFPPLGRFTTIHHPLLPFGKPCFNLTLVLVMDYKWSHNPSFWNAVTLLLTIIEPVIFQNPSCKVVISLTQLNITI